MNKIKKLLKSNKYTKKIILNTLILIRTIYYKLCCTFNSVDDKTIIFESFMGASYADSGKAIYEEMLKDERFKDFTFVWSFKNPDSKKSIESLKRSILVKHRSLDYYKYYSKAKYFVSNSRIDTIIQRREGQVYIQTWHGTPLKRLGYDIEIGNNALHTQEELCKLYRLDAERYSYLLSPSKFTTDKLTSAFNLPVNSPNVEIIEEGYPRNDFLCTYTQDNVDSIKKQLGIESNQKKIILYAPTWRDNQYKNGGYSYELGIDFDKLQKELSDDYIILFRAHYFVSSIFDFSKYEGFIYNVSNVDNVNDLYVISDLLITDYSSVFFDYSILKRPVLFYMYDLKDYQDVLRGFYISLDELCGPIIEKEDDLIKEIKKEFVYDSKYQRFNDTYTYLDDGNASKRVIDRIFKA